MKHCDKTTKTSDYFMNDLLERLVLQEIDIRLTQVSSQVEKAVLELFKSAILKKYKVQYDIEIKTGMVKRETLDKTMEFLFNEACVKYRLLPGIDDATKDVEINQAKMALNSLKQVIIKMLEDRGIKVLYQ